jgi:ABC-type lipoprotein release transport system permease subunit
MSSTPTRFWVKTAFLFLSRSGRATAMLSLMVVAAVAMLIFLSSLAVGVNDTMIRNSVGLFSGHITGRGLKPSLTKEQLRLTGTRAVLKRIPLRGRLSSGPVSEKITLLGVDPHAERKATVIWKKTVAGRYLTGEPHSLYLGLGAAEILGAGVGSRLQFIPDSGGAAVPLTVSGLFKTGIDALDRDVAFCPYGAVAGRGTTWQAAVFLKDGYDPEKLISAYQRFSIPGMHFTSWKEQMPDLLQLIDLNYVSMSVVMVLVFGVVALGISCAFIIFILRNLREYGIMKAMGVSPWEMGLLITSEVVLMNLGACVIGLLLGSLAVMLWGNIGVDLTALTSHNRYFAVSGVIYPRLTAYSLFVPPLLSLFFGLLAAVWPVVTVIRKSPAEILRIV